MSWEVLKRRVQDSELAKDTCKERGVTFRNLSAAEQKALAVQEVLLLEGEKLRDHMNTRRDGRKAADCLFLVRKADGTIHVVVVELKSGWADDAIFVQQCSHSVEDLRLLFDKVGAGPLPTPRYATPRFPPTFDRLRVTKRLPELRVVDSLAKMLA